MLTTANQPVAIATRRQSRPTTGATLNRWVRRASGGGTRYPHTGTPPPTTTTTTQAEVAMAACMEEADRVAAAMQAADRAGDRATAQGHHDRLNALTKEYLRWAKEAGQY